MKYLHFGKGTSGTFTQKTTFIKFIYKIYIRLSIGCLDKIIMSVWPFTNNHIFSFRFCLKLKTIPLFYWNYETDQFYCYAPAQIFYCVRLFFEYLLPLQLTMASAERGLLREILLKLLRSTINQKCKELLTIKSEMAKQRKSRDIQIFLIFFSFII